MWYNHYMTFKNSTLADDHKSGITPSFTLRLLIVCISVALYVLLAVFAGLILTGADFDLSRLFTRTSLGVWSIILIACLGIFIGLSAIYVVCGMLRSTKALQKYYKFYQTAGLVFLFLIFVSLGVVLSLAIMTLSPARWSAAVLVLISGLLAFAPVLSTWKIEDEERLKNFIDAMAKTCTTLTFIGGGCALLLKVLFS